MKPAILLIIILVFVTSCVRSEETRSIGGCSYGCSQYDSIYQEDVELVNNKTYTISISGNGSSDLDLFVFDKSGDLLCSSETDTDDELCTFKTKFDNHFKFRVYWVYIKNNDKQVVNNYRYKIEFK